MDFLDLPPELLEYESYSYLPFDEIYRLRRSSQKWYRTYLRELQRRAKVWEPWHFVIQNNNGEVLRDLLRSTKNLPVNPEELIHRLLVMDNTNLLEILLENLPGADEILVDLVYNRMGYSIEGFVKKLYENPNLITRIIGPLQNIHTFLVDVYSYLRDRMGREFVDFYLFLRCIYDMLGYLPREWLINYMDYLYPGEDLRESVDNIVYTFEVESSLNLCQQDDLVRIIRESLEREDVQNNY